MSEVNFSSFTFMLFILYTSLSIFIGLQLSRIVYFRHKLRSFQVGFLVQLFFWALLRSIFFLLIDVISEVAPLFLIIYWIPINIQFSTFSLLVVYYAHLHQRDKLEWRNFKRKYILIWASLNVLFLILAAIWIGLGIALDEPGSGDPSWLAKIHSGFTGTVFFILVIVLAWQGWRAAHLMKEKPTVGQTKLLAKVSFPKILVVTFSLFILFTSRCLYNFITLAGPLQLNISSGLDHKALFTFIAFCLWEIIPTILVLVLFGKVTATTLGAFAKHKHFSRNPNYQKIDGETIGFLPKAQLFNDPRRYDSDDETTALSKQSPSLFYGSSNSPVYPYAVRNINSESY